MSSDRDKGIQYWKTNIALVRNCLIIWAVVSFGLGIIFRPLVSWIPIGGTDIGFWFAQQGSILVFIALIFYYAYRMNKIDKDFDVEE